jgi:P4 family phage/plasmid primase-like protien
MYREAGWLGTLPLPEGQKDAPPRGYTGNGRPYPTDLEVQRWIKYGHPEMDETEANIALRLADVPGYVPPGCPPVGYELMALDVDDYGEKHGADTLRKLEQQYGELPTTLRSSSRWASSSVSAHYLFLVPAGLRFLGKAGPGIEIIQKGHRYIVAWPSTNPDFNNEVYRWRYGDRDYDGIPALDDVAVLPDPWIDYLTCNRRVAIDVAVSDLDGDELMRWAMRTFNDSKGDMCPFVQRRLADHIGRLEIAEQAHDSMIDAHWNLINLGPEGHSGWLTAVNAYNEAWREFASAKRDDPMGINSEIRRSIFGTVSKLKPKFEELGGYLVEDQCDAADTELPTDNWESDWLHIDDPDGLIAAGDYGGLGNVVGKMSKADTEPEKYEHNDWGNGKHLIDIYGDNIKYVTTRKSWVLWDGERWHRDNENNHLIGLAFDVVKRRQIAYANNLPISDDKADIAYKRMCAIWGKKSGNDTQVTNALKMARRMYVTDNESVALNGNIFDSRPDLLGCENGILELSAEPVLRQPRKDDYVTYNTKVPYYPWDSEHTDQYGLTESYKLWQEYLKKFLPDANMRKFVQKVLGHCLIGENPEKLIIFILGEHDTGKSTLLGGIRGALGDYYGTIDVHLFRNKDLNPGLIRAVPLRVTGMSEIDSQRLDGSIVKRLTGNDTVTAEAKYSNDIFEGRPQFTTLIACNSEPEIAGADEALRERVLVLPFETQIPRADKDYNRQAAIERDSGPAVLAWLVEGWKMYCAEGLRRRDWPARVRRFSGEAVSNFNGSLTFIHEHVEKYRDCKEGVEAHKLALRRAAAAGRQAPNATDWPDDWVLPSGMLYDTYRRWATNANMPVVSSIQFGKDLGVGKAENRHYGGSSPRCYKGVRRRDADD